MATLAYGLCALTSILCFLMLMRTYFQTRTRLVLWSSMCFFFLAVQNIMLFVDLVVLIREVDLQGWRTASGFIGSITLLFALIWENK